MSLPIKMRNAADKTDLSLEEQAVLYLSRIDLQGGHAEEIRGFLRDHASKLDYHKVWALARMNLVSPLLFRNLMNIEGIPADVMNGLKEAYLITLKRNLVHAGETVNILDLLREAGIDAIPIKGSLASEIVLGDMGLYPTGDIDLLVRQSDLGRAKSALLNTGYTEDAARSEGDLLESSYHLIFARDGDVIELHWDLLKWFFKGSPDFWWEETMKVGYEGQEITLLSPERYLLYCIFHLFTHRFAPLKFYLLIAGLIYRYRKEIRWDRLFAFASQHRMIRLTTFTLRLLHDFFGTEIPDECLNRDIFGYGLLRYVVVSGLFQEMKRSYVRLAFFTILLDSPLDTLGVLLRRILPLPSEIRLRYGLSAGSRKVYLYYLMNPFLMMIKKR